MLILSNFQAFFLFLKRKIYLKGKIWKRRDHLKNTAEEQFY